MAFTRDGKRVLLVNPSGNSYWVPLALAYLKSNIPPDRYDVKILDCTAENIQADSQHFRSVLDGFKPEVVGVTSLTATAREALDILRISKQSNPGIMTIMGGTHATVYPQDVMKNHYCDFVLRGEGEKTFPQFLDVLGSEQRYPAIKGLVYRQGPRLIQNEIPFDANLDDIKFPDYSFLLKRGWLGEGIEHYGIKAPLWLTRGCPYGCRFCSAYLVNGHKIRAHSIDYAMRWIRHLYYDLHVRHFSVIDDNFTFNIDYAKEFCRGVISLKKEEFKEPIFFENSNGVRMQFLDDELLSLMREAGWWRLHLAPESGSRRTLKRMNKKLDPDIVPGIVNMVRKAGIRVGGDFIVGYPGETKEDINETVRLIRKCRFDTIIIYQFCPLPGTPIFNDLVAQKEISEDYMPSTFLLNYLSPRKAKDDAPVYVTKDLKDFNFRWLAFREYFLLGLRNPYFVIGALRSGKIQRLFKLLRFSPGPMNRG